MIPADFTRRCRENVWLAAHLHLIVPPLFSGGQIKEANHNLLLANWHRYSPKPETA